MVGERRQEGEEGAKEGVMFHQRHLRSVLSLCAMVLVFAGNLAPAPAQRQNKVKPPGITELTLDRGYCHGVCPVYTVTFREDGSMEYVGTAFVDKLGAYKVSGDESTKRQFRRLAELATVLQLQKLKSSYVAAFNDIQWTTLTIKKAGKAQEITTTEGDEPTSLWGFEIVIDQATVSALKDEEWEKVKDPAS